MNKDLVKEIKITDIENIKIIDMLDKVSLNKNGKPDPSDHFPIYCELKGER